MCVCVCVCVCVVSMGCVGLRGNGVLWCRSFRSPPPGDASPERNYA